MSTSSKLCQLNGGCMGCCGHDFLSKKMIQKAIELNTTEFKTVDPHKEISLHAFRDRMPAYDLRYGVCRNLIESNKQLLCPLHPALNDGKDLRVGHCELNYMCPTAKLFETWKQEKQEKFIKFIESKKLDHLSYSMGMVNEKLLNEFYSQ
ncbi:hypothetical protein HOD05_01315 [Candidatus Woesearchaeota archaeon]|jgi:hypothetical protein|nr:hypothetical protein [Candidatus Woesearchaeota archaeon]MBT4151045.1 hypothetical protein [Candidatus Woesearchaeota archaeon]MBT4247578.1 hypothetical protein [Candidatus Woesearchaeota archaeon]MBT4433835.1 hypothetical protein [Candidatus Woesearchaeota archaeon]MBT7332166.1 hypothetical protein [Candidatus Woesearchaeota archaeon]